MNTLTYARRNRSRGLCRCGRTPVAGLVYCASCRESRARSLARQQAKRTTEPRRNFGVDLTGVPSLPRSIALKIKQSKPLTDAEAAGHVIQSRVERLRFTGEAFQEEQEDLA